jgi:hypothetical protein
MNRHICLAAISLAVALTGATAAVAAHKAKVTHASAQATDPRKMVGNGHATWCDVSSTCNGWDKWLQMVNEGKLKIAAPNQ